MKQLYILFFLYFCLSLTLAVADGLPPHTNPFKVLGSCYPKAQVKLASKVCANGWSHSTYPSWGDSNEDDINAAKKVEQPKRIMAGKGNSFTVLDVRQDTRMVQIESNGEKLWVDADALDCDGKRNVGMYQLPPPSADDGRCPKVDVMVNINYLFANNVSDSQAELGFALGRKAEEYHNKMKANVNHDNKTLIDAFRNTSISDDDRYQILTAAYSKISRMYNRVTAVFGTDCDKTDFPPQTFEISRERGERECRTMVRTYNMLAKLMGTTDRKKLLSGFDNIMTGAQIASDPNNDQVAMRTIIYYGMGLDKPQLPTASSQAKLKSSLKLVNSQSIDISNMEATLGMQQGPAFDELMNGYLYAQQGSGSGSAVECAAFAMNYLLGMHRVADTGGKGAMPNVTDFENLHRAKSGEGPRHIPYFDEYSNCFDMVDLRKDERPVPGDFVSSHGHVVIIKFYDPLHRDIETIEASSGKCGSVCNETRPLYEPACVGVDGNKSEEWELRPLRSDIRVLRYSPKPGCPIPTNVPKPTPETTQAER